MFLSLSYFLFFFFLVGGVKSICKRRERLKARDKGLSLTKLQSCEGAPWLFYAYVITAILYVKWMCNSLPLKEFCEN